MTGYLQNIIDAISLGSLYALAALGLGLIYGVMRLINFAHGDFITVGAYALILPSANPTAVMVIGGWPWPFLVVGVTLIVVILALLAEFIVFRPMRSASPASMMVAAFALSYVIQHVILAVYESRPKAVDLWSNLNLPIDVAGVRVPRLELVTIGVTVALLGALVLFLKRTHYGIEMRGASEDFVMARLLGVKANRVIATAFGISGVLAASVSLLFVTQTGILSYQMSVPILLTGFIATVIGGMGSLAGATLGGFAIGCASVILQNILPLSLRPFRDAFVYFFVVLVLVFRPQGLIKVRAVQERV